MDIQAIKDRILSDIRIQYPETIIHEVKSFRKDDHGFYNVTVIIEKDVFNGDNEVVKLKRHSTTFPFPRYEYEKLTDFDKEKWTESNVFRVTPMGKPSGQLFYLDFVYGKD